MSAISTKTIMDKWIIQFFCDAVELENVHYIRNPVPHSSRVNYIIKISGKRKYGSKSKFNNKTAC